MIVDAEVADVFAYGSKIEKRYGDSSARELMDHAQADFRSHYGHAANFVLHHSFGGFARSARIVVGVAEDRVVTKLARARLKTLDHLGEEWILDVRHDDAKRAACTRGQVARVNVREVSEALDRREYEGMRAAPYFSGLVQHVGDCGGGHARGFCDIANG